MGLRKNSILDLFDCTVFFSSKTMKIFHLRQSFIIDRFQFHCIKLLLQILDNYFFKRFLFMKKVNKNRLKIRKC